MAHRTPLLLVVALVAALVAAVTLSPAPASAQALDASEWAVLVAAYEVGLDAADQTALDAELERRATLDRRMAAEYGAAVETWVRTRLPAVLREAGARGELAVVLDGSALDAAAGDPPAFAVWWWFRYHAGPACPFIVDRGHGAGGLPVYALSMP